MPLNPEPKYEIVPEQIHIWSFHQFPNQYIIRPPYQRKPVWSEKKEQTLLDSLFRRSYIPRIVLRQVRVSENETKLEVIDGQQRINTVVKFFNNELCLPKSLSDVDERLPGKFYAALEDEIKEFVYTHLKYSADKVVGIDDPRKLDDLDIASDIFWRLQLGDKLNAMEQNHAKLFSRLRNFIVKFGDDYTFDYDAYETIEENKDKHKFFKIYNSKNNKMQHLSLLARFVLIEKGYAETTPPSPGDANNKFVTSEIKATLSPQKIGDESLDYRPVVSRVKSNLNLFYSIFKDDPMLDSSTGIRELSEEYFVISIYLLIRYLRSNCVTNATVKKALREFVQDFHWRWKNAGPDDTEFLLFHQSRQPVKAQLENRDSIVRLAFLRFLKKKGVELKYKDNRRAFSQLERVEIYRKTNGKCADCGETVSWSKFHADHITPHSKGGETATWNGQVLCRDCNLKKSASVQI